MKTYLFLWNPDKWSWDSLEEDVSKLKSDGKFSQMWSCKNHKQVQIGDRAFLIKLGKGIPDKGIIGAGYVISESFLAEHWSGNGKLTNRVIIEFELVAERNESSIIPMSTLNSGEMAHYKWSAIASGVEIPNEIAKALETVWFSKNKNIYIEKNTHTLTEGNPYDLKITKYERNPVAREKCLEYYGFACSVCKTDFEKVYGEIGKNFIHVHHLIKISDRKNEYEIDPINDLRPVCPNCHSMIHKRKIPYSIEEMKKIYNR